MLMLRVDRVEQVGTIAVLHGTVEKDFMTVGDDVVLVSASGERDPAYLVGIMPGRPGLHTSDRAGAGDRVKVTFRRAAKTFADSAIVAIERPAAA